MVISLMDGCCDCTGDSTVGKTALVQSFSSDGTQYSKNYNMVSICGLYSLTLSCQSFAQNLFLMMVERGVDVLLSSFVRS